MTDDIHAEPSAAAVAVETPKPPEFNPADQHTWSPEQREHWNETGDIPKPKKQDPAPADKPKEAISDTAAESETASKQGTQDRKPGTKLNAEERKAQLASEIKKLSDEVKELKAERERSRATEPNPAAKEPTKIDAPKRPNPFQWTGTAEEFETAMEKWEAHQRDEVIQKFQREAQAEANMQRLVKQMDEVVAKYPGTTREQLGKTAAVFNEAELPGVIKNMLYDTDVLPDLMYLFTDEETRTNFIEQAQKNPGKAIRALAQMENDIKIAISAKPAVEKSESKAAPAETKPRAPKPPSEVGGRGAAPEDELRSAATAGDFRRFEAEENRRKFARN